MKIRLTVMVLMMMLLSTSVQAKLLTKSVSYQHECVKLEGYLSYKDSFKGNRSAVLVVHEWLGLNDYARTRAEQLAGLGYVAFALDMYGKGKVTTHPSQAYEYTNQINSNVHNWQQRTLAGLEMLRKNPK
jgi:dienelactone hydrolase